MRVVVLAVCFAAVALSGCRREEPTYEPMKLGGAVQQTTQQ